MKSKGNRHFVWAILATALGVAVVWIVDDEVADRHLKEHRTQVVDKVKTVHAKLESALNSRLSLVQGLAAFVKSRKELAGARHERFAEEFNAYTDELLKDVGGIRSLQLAPDAVVTYINPLKGNERALGHDLMADPVRREAAERAIRKRHFVVAGPVELRQGGVALIGRLPIFLPLADDEKSERFWGFSIILLDLAPLLTEAGISDQASGLKFALRGKDGLGARGAVFFGDGAIFDADPVVQDVILPDNSWQVAALPVEGWDHTEELFPLRAFGGAMAVAIGGLLFVLFSGREKLATNEKRLRSAFEAIDEGIWDWNIVTGEVVFSPNWPKIFGYSLDEIEHHVDTWESWLHPDDKAEVMKAVNDHFEGRTPYYVSEHRMKNKDGAWLWILDRGKVIEWDNGGKPIRMVRADLDITERKRAEEALRENEERFRQIYENTPGMLHSIDRDGRLLNVSDYWLDTLGYDREEVLGRKVYEFYSEESRRYAKEETLPEFFRTGFAKELPFQVVKKNGEVMDVLLTAMAVRDDQGNFVRSLAVMIDITERKRAEEALRESEERFRTIAANIPGNVYRRILHADGRLTWAYLSAGLRDILELDPDEVMERPEVLLETLHPEDRARWQDALRKSAETLEPYDLEFRRITPSGKVVWLRSIARPHRRQNGDVVWDGVALDITEQKEAQAQLIRTSRLATLGEMASGIAHELNQPLTNMRMMAENALAYIESADVDADVQTRKLEGVIGQVDRMAGIVDHMRLFSRKDSAERETFSPTACAADAIGMVENQYRALGIRLEKDLPARCRNVSGHRFKLEQVILNLLSNARDAAAARADRAAREGREFVPEVSVRVAEDRKTDTVILSVSDNGGGVPGDVLDEIFHPFFTTKAEGQGTGLGLSISYSIIDTMGGRIEVRNAEGGARFDVILPVADEAHPRLPAPKPQDHVPQEQPPVAADRRGRLVRVLVVDDEEPTARNTAEYLEYAGYVATIAGNGAEALKLFASDSFDVVVTDRGMPVMDGNEMIRRLRALDPNLPIIAMTGQGAFDDGQTASTAGNDGAAAAGASVVLRMPVRLRDLEGHVRRLTRA